MRATIRCDSTVGLNDPFRTVGIVENVVVRISVLLTILLLLSGMTFASDSGYILNFDLIVKLPDGSDNSSIQQQGISISPQVALHGNDFGKFEYFLTVSDVEDGKGKLTIEFYEYETRRKTDDIVSEIVAEVDFSLANPAVFEAMNDKFGIDLAFSIAEK